MHTHHPHPRELAAGADGMGTALRSAGQELKPRGDYGACPEGGCAAKLYRIDTPDEGRVLRMAAGISASSN